MNQVLKHAVKKRSCRRKYTRKIGAAGLTVVLLLTCLPFGSLAAGQSSYDETYYGTLDWYGGLKDGAVVKSYNMNGNTAILDYGTYTDVTNLTDNTQPVVKDGTVSFRFPDNAPNYFYFQGKTAEPYKTFPWTIKISYRFNGVDTKAEDMAGQKGLAEINLDLVPNNTASEYAADNYSLEIMTAFKDDDILSLEAPGAQVQLLGNMRAVMFMVLPGEEQHYTIRVGSNDFSFGGLFFLAQPVTLAQLDQVSELRDAKETMEDSYKAVNASLDTLLNALDGLDGNLLQTANGLDELNGARGTIDSHADSIYSSLNSASTSMINLKDSLAPVSDHLSTLKSAITESKNTLKQLSDNTAALKTELTSTKKNLSVLQTDLDDLATLLEDIQTETDDNVQPTIGHLYNDLGILQTNLQNLSTKTSALKEAMDSANNISVDSSSGKFVITVPGTNQSIDNLITSLTQAEALHTAYVNSGSSNTFLEFLKDYLYQQYYQGAYNQAYTSYYTAYKNAGMSDADAQAQAASDASTAAKAYADGQATTISTNATSLNNLYDNRETLHDAYDLENSLNNGTTDYRAAVKLLQTISEPTSNAITSLNTVSDTLSDKVLDDSRDLLFAVNNILDSITDYDGNLADDTGILIKNVSNTLDNVDKSIDLLVSLDNTINKYEPDLQSSLDDGIKQTTAATSMMDSLSTLMSSVNQAAQDSRTSLNQGTNDSLTGFAAALRHSAAGLSGTATIRNAKGSVTRLIDDKWDEFTGGKNNLLLMDPNAAGVSLTSARNPVPNSVQIILRSEEITLDSTKSDDTNTDQPTDHSTFWSRIGRMFQDFWGAITNLF